MLQDCKKFLTAAKSVQDKIEAENFQEFKDEYCLPLECKSITEYFNQICDMGDLYARYKKRYEDFINTKWREIDKDIPADVSPFQALARFSENG